MIFIETGIGPQMREHWEWQTQVNREAERLEKTGLQPVTAERIAQYNIEVKLEYNDFQQRR